MRLPTFYFYFIRWPPFSLAKLFFVFTFKITFLVQLADYLCDDFPEVKILDLYFNLVYQRILVKKRCTNIFILTTLTILLFLNRINLTTRLILSKFDDTS